MLDFGKNLNYRLNFNLYIPKFEIFKNAFKGFIICVYFLYLIK
jgi:hypothetical protein